jgi:hypothetical protein
MINKKNNQAYEIAFGCKPNNSLLKKAKNSALAEFYK